MPYSLRKVPNKKCYRVTNRKTKRVMAKCTSKIRANKQMRLLRAIENNRKFVPRGRARKSMRKRGGMMNPLGMTTINDAYSAPLTVSAPPMTSENTLEISQARPELTQGIRDPLMP